MVGAPRRARFHTLLPIALCVSASGLAELGNGVDIGSSRMLSVHKRSRFESRLVIPPNTRRVVHPHRSDKIGDALETRHRVRTPPAPSCCFEVLFAAATDTLSGGCLDG